jgi:hypothetical protein
VQKRFRAEFKPKEAPTAKTIKAIVDKFERTGSVLGDLVGI